MPIYRIGLCLADKSVEQMDVELPDCCRLRSELATFAGQMLKDQPHRIWSDGDWRIEATDESGLILYVLVLFAAGSAATTSVSDTPK